MRCRSGLPALFLSCAWVLCGLVLGPAEVWAAGCAAAKITVSGLNVRVHPSVASAIAGTVNTGEIYVMTGRSAGDWREIWYDDQARWIHAQEYAVDVTVACGRVSSSILNVRSGPGENYRIVGSAPENSKWAVIASHGVWQKIWYASEARWVHGGYLNQSSPLPGIVLRSFRINRGAATTGSRFVQVDSQYGGSSAKYYRVSEEVRFHGALWQAYSSTVRYTLSGGGGNKKVYFQLRNAEGRLSNVLSDSIVYTPPPAQGFKVDRAKFYRDFRAKFGYLGNEQVSGINYLLKNMESDRRPAIKDQTVWMRQIAYLFSTVKHEVANTYHPITEYSNTYCVHYDGGCLYKGRGYVQLTHRYNYRKMSPVVGVDLIDYPTRALEPDIAYNVMSYGMFEGVFTGRALGDYIYAGKSDYYNARRVVNGLDRAGLLQGYARDFQYVMERSTSGL